MKGLLCHWMEIYVYVVKLGQSLLTISNSNDKCPLYGFCAVLKNFSERVLTYIHTTKYIFIYIPMLVGSTAANISEKVTLTANQTNTPSQYISFIKINNLL